MCSEVTSGIVTADETERGLLEENARRKRQMANNNNKNKRTRVTRTPKARSRASILPLARALYQFCNTNSW